MASFGFEHERPGTPLPRSGDGAARPSSTTIAPMKTRSLAFVTTTVFVLSIVVACDSDDSDSGLPSPGDACDGSKPIMCGSLAKGSDRRDVVIVCKNGVFESVMDCKPGGSGNTNRCFAQGSFTIVDCVDEPSPGSVTRCEVSGSGTELSHSCRPGRY